MSVKLPADFAKAISESLAVTPLAVAELFEIEEDKQGFFVAKLKPQQFLEKMQFRTMCTLVRDLGGEDYLEGAKAWKVPGPFAKKGAEKPSGQAMDRQPTNKEPGNAVPGPMGVAPRVVTDDKSRPPQTTVPIKALLSMPFQCRVNLDDPTITELTESIKALGVLHPILVRPKPNGLYEIVYGQRRVKAAEKAGLIEIPANIRILSDQEAYEIQFTENIQREDLSDMEKARMLNFLTTKFGYTQEALAKKLGKEKLWVARHLAILNLETVSPGIQTGAITERQAREILAASPEKREEILDKIKETGEVPSARELEQMRKPSIPCGRCGDPSQGPPAHLEGKFYCQECYEQVAAESVPSLLPEAERVEEPEEEPTPPEPPAVDIGGFECPECHKHFIVEHLPNGKHKLKQLREAEE
jgi:ParB/RepB/Spo0J family partition protein